MSVKIFINLLRSHFQICSEKKCPPCNSQHIRVEHGPIHVGKCIKTVHDNRRESQHKYVCAALVLGSCQNPETLAAIHCTVLPYFSEPKKSKLLAYDCCNNKLSSKRQVLMCTGELDTTKRKKINL